jgi:cytoskeletal protein CcmA (bactofilin family)
MFSKAQTRPADPAETPRRPSVASLIAEGVLIRGDFGAAGDLHLDGALEGDLHADRVVLGGTGAVSGSIHADTVEVHGRVTGTINARQVRLCATARVDGDIAHAELSIEAGAHFEGRSLVRAPATETALSVVAAE